MVEMAGPLKTFLGACLFLCCSFFVIIKSASLTYATEIEKPFQAKNTVASEKQETIQSQGNILVIGDSISAAFGLKKSEGWVALLEKELAGKYQMVNASISGDTTSGGRYRLAKALDHYQPKFVIIELGGNDGLRGTPVKQIRANLQAMVNMVKDAGAQAILLGMMIPPNYGERYTSAFASIYAELASEMNIPLVPFLLEGVAGIGGMMQDDGIHPTAAAQPIMMHHVKEVLAPLL